MSHFYHNRWFGKSRLLIPPFARFPLSVPAISYQKAEISLVIEVDPGDPWQLYVNDQLLTSGIGTGESQLTSGTLTRAMVADPATYLLTTANGMTASATGVVWGPDLLGAKLLSWHDETGTFDATGWAATGGTDAPLLVPGAGQLPTTGSRFGKRTIITDGATQALAASFGRGVTGETWTAARWLGPQLATMARFLISGRSTISGSIRQPSAAVGPANRILLTNSSGGVTADLSSNIEDRWMILGGIYSTTAGEAAVIENGTVIATNVSNGTNPEGMTIGATNALSGWGSCEYGEIINTLPFLTLDEREYLNTYLSSAWPIGA